MSGQSLAWSDMIADQSKKITRERERKVSNLFKYHCVMITKLIIYEGETLTNSNTEQSYCMSIFK